jgi:hypothetical protein
MIRSSIVVLAIFSLFAAAPSSAADDDAADNVVYVLSKDDVVALKDIAKSDGRVAKLIRDVDVFAVLYKYVYGPI